MSIFTSVKTNNIKRAAFNLSHERKLSCEPGKLVPIFCQEVLPGDKWLIDTQSLIRLAPLVSPVMHRINSYIHFFFVPNRLLWDNWEEFITGEAAITVPKQNLAQVEVQEGSLADHLGIPTGIYDDQDFDENVNLLPFRAYFKIFNDYYRDQNLQDEVDLTTVELTDALLRRAWEKDYFTSALPTPQKGQAVNVEGEITYKHAVIYDDTGFPAGSGAGLETLADIGQGNYVGTTASSNNTYIDNVDTVNIEVEELRRAQRLQRFLERNMRAGTRYVEQLLAHFNVRSKDARLQRAEYIGGGKSPVVITEVTSNAMTIDPTEPETVVNPVGELAGRGINIGRTNTASYYATEHGWIMGILSIMPEPSYQQGLHKMFSRLTQLDYAFPEFAQLGEQEVKNKEIKLVDGAASVNNGTFGYQSRYAELKYVPSTVHGAFRSTLQHWHWSRIFANQPELNEDFIKCYPDNRIFAVEDQKEQFYCLLYHRVKAVRPLPFHNDPRL